MMKNSATLEIATPTPREIVLTRAFDAPRPLVFDALTRPDLLKRWFGPRGWSLAICEIDLQVGGAYRYLSHRPNGKDIGQRGIYQEIVPPERLVHTETWEDWDAGEVLVTTVLTERDGQTLLTTTVLYPSQEVRDTILNAGAKHGASETYDKLEEFLATLTVGDAAAS
jgi:uncharacterized protein YndB with AHSA1/START domain